MQITFEAGNYAHARATGIEHLFQNHNTVGILADLSRNSVKRRIGPMRQNSGPRKWTSDVIAEARDLYSEFHLRVREGRKFCNRNPQITGEIAAIQDKKLHPKRPKMPKAIVAELRRKSHARNRLLRSLGKWTAIELNHRYPQLSASPASIKKILKPKRRTSIAVVKADIPLSESTSID